MKRKLTALSYSNPLTGRWFSVLAAIVTAILPTSLAFGKPKDGFAWFPTEHDENKRVLVTCSHLFHEVVVEKIGQTGPRQRLGIWCGEVERLPIAIILTTGTLIEHTELHGAYRCERQSDNCTELLFSQSVVLSP